MKNVIFFFLLFVALAAAAPQFITYPGLWGGAPYGLAPRTLVAGPTVVNGLTWPGRIVTTNGLLGTTLI